MDVMCDSIFDFRPRHCLHTQNDHKRPSLVDEPVLKRRMYLPWLRGRRKRSSCSEITHASTWWIFSCHEWSWWNRAWLSRQNVCRQSPELDTLVDVSTRNPDEYTRTVDLVDEILYSMQIPATNGVALHETWMFGISHDDDLKRT